MTARKEEKLGVFGAIWASLWGRDIAFFPRVLDTKGRLVALDDKAAILQVSDEIKTLTPEEKEEKLDDLLKLARQSLDEVTAQTDYQDGKATRLLTILTFMSAFSGLLFNRLADGYPISTLTWVGTQTSAVSLGVIICYLLFALFAFCAVSGALVTFHAIRARFRYPKEAAKDVGPGSLLFYIPISRTQPAQWGKAFLDPSDSSKLRPDLKVEYLKNYIVESYLVAAKVADKMRFLEPAQRLQSWAIKVLLVWLLCVVGLFAFVSPLKKESNPMIRAVVTPSSSTCIIGGNDVSPEPTSKLYSAVR